MAPGSSNAGANDPFPRTSIWDDLLDTAECHLDIGIAIRERVGRQGDAVVYQAEWGGSVQRTVTNENGDGFGFWLHLHWPDATVRTIGRDRVGDHHLSGDGRGRPVYHALEVMQGHVTGPGRPTGTWECAPLDIWEGGYIDTVTVAAGTWSMQPLR